MKLHIGVDTQGLPHTIMITTADFSDREGAINMFEYYISFTKRLLRLQKVLVDGGYTGIAFASAIRSLTGAEVEVAKRNEIHKFAIIPKRWVVERTFGWLDKCRRLWKNCERRLHNTFQMIRSCFHKIMKINFPKQ